MFCLVGFIVGQCRIDVQRTRTRTACMSCLNDDERSLILCFFGDRMEVVMEGAVKEEGRWEKCEADE